MYNFEVDQKPDQKALWVHFRRTFDALLVHFWKVFLGVICFSFQSLSQSLGFSGRADIGSSESRAKSLKSVRHYKLRSLMSTNLAILQGVPHKHWPKLWQQIQPD